ncbi:MAG: chemotaxis-specific protein-glutamate methyltransferase CheB [Cytophagales bacterium]
MKDKKKILLVDDSGFMRMVLSDMMSSYDDIEVIDTAENGKEAFEKTITNSPDVVLLDLTMKDYDGMYAIKHIMESKPTPIVILSSIRTTDPQVAIDALEAGAVDFLDKPTGLLSSKVREISEQIYLKLKDALKIDIQNVKKNKKINHVNFAHSFESDLPFKILTIGASTGGTGAIEQILLNFPSNFPLPIVIAQHIPNEFVSSFAKRLSETCQKNVVTAFENDIIKPGFVYVLKADSNMKVSKSLNGLCSFKCTSQHFKEFNHPSVDCLFESVAESFGATAMGVLLTGMGKDGALGLKKISEQGGFTLAQDEKSSIVWGMPKAAIELGAAKHIVPLNEISNFIVSAIC